MDVAQGIGLLFVKIGLVLIVLSMFTQIRWIFFILLQTLALVSPPLALYLDAAARAVGFELSPIILTPTKIHVALILGVSVSTMVTAIFWRWSVLPNPAGVDEHHAGDRSDNGVTGLVIQGGGSDSRRMRLLIRTVLGFLHGSSLAVSFLYSAVLVLAKLLPLFPLVCLVGSVSLRRVLIRAQTVPERFFSPSVVGGICVSCFLLMMAEIPRTVTRLFLEASHPEEAPLDVSALRYFGDWGTLVRAAQGRTPQFSDVLSLLEARIWGEHDHAYFYDTTTSVAREAIALLSGKTEAEVLSDFERNKGFISRKLSRSDEVWLGP